MFNNKDYSGVNTHKKKKIATFNILSIFNFSYCFSVLLGFLTKPRTPFWWSFPQPRIRIWFFWVFIYTEVPLLVGRFSTPPPPRLLFGSSGVLPTPRSPSGWPFTQHPSLLFGSSGVLPLW